MTKKNLFSALAFLCAVGWLQIIGLKSPLEFALYGLLINIGLDILYSFCKDDQKDDE